MKTKTTSALQSLKLESFALFGKKNLLLRKLDIYEFDSVGFHHLRKVSFLWKESEIGILFVWW